MADQKTSRSSERRVKPSSRNSTKMATDSSTMKSEPRCEPSLVKEDEDLEASVKADPAEGAPIAEEAAVAEEIDRRLWNMTFK